MKHFLPAAAMLACSTLLISCGHKPAGSADADQQAEEIRAEARQAEQERALQEQQAALDERERLLAQREQQLAAATPAPAPAPAAAIPNAVAPAPVPAPAVSADASYQAFYDSLSPYGTWVAMPGYGYVWQPTATLHDPGWRPYTLGHWAFTDAGWTWVSNEPFGWITYHYGRWMRTRNLDWVWLPGDLWAPAWVSWRYGNDFVGWAPLPPEARFDGAAGIQQWADQQYSLGASDYTFVPAADFGDESMAGIEVPLDQNAPIYDESNNVTNIYDDGGAIICYGPTYEFLRSKSRRPLPPPLKLGRHGFRANGGNSAFISGNTLQVAAPRIVPTRAPTAPRAARPAAADIRLIAPATTPPPHGSLLPPLYKPPQQAQQALQSEQARPARIGMVSTPGPATLPAAEQRLIEAAVPVENERESNARTAPAPATAPTEDAVQRAREAEIARRQQAAQEAEARRKEADIAAEQQAAQQRAAARSAEEAVAKTEHEQAAREAAARQAQPPSLPAPQHPGASGANPNTQ